MKWLYTILLFTVFVFLSIQIRAQVDPHFSQYYAFPLYLNPAFTGVIDGDYRATAIYKNQWVRVGKPYSTVGLSADMTTLKNLNLGIHIINQTAGDGGYRYQEGYFSLAYQGLRLDANAYRCILLGLQVGYIDRRFDPSKLRFGDQWTPYVGFDPNLQTAEVFTKTASTDFNAGAGITYVDNDPGKKTNIFGGFSMNNLTQPTDPFIATGEKKVLPIRYTIYGGAKIKMSQDLSCTPNFIYMRQGNAEERMLGLDFQMATQKPDIDVMAGFSFRYKDSWVPYFGLKYTNVLLGVSYDATSSTLNRSLHFTNSLELSITVIGRRDKTYTARYDCPLRF